MTSKFLTWANRKERKRGFQERVSLGLVNWRCWRETQAEPSSRQLSGPDWSLPDKPKLEIEMR